MEKNPCQEVQAKNSKYEHTKLQQLQITNKTKYIYNIDDIVLKSDTTISSLPYPIYMLSQISCEFYDEFNKFKTTTSQNYCHRVKTCI